jgi:hypothetical protein
VQQGDIFASFKDAPGRGILIGGKGRKTTTGSSSTSKQATIAEQRSRIVGISRSGTASASKSGPVAGGQRTTAPFPVLQLTSEDSEPSQESDNIRNKENKSSNGRYAPSGKLAGRGREKDPGSSDLRKKKTEGGGGGSAGKKEERKPAPFPMSPPPSRSTTTSFSSQSVIAISPVASKFASINRIEDKGKGKGKADGIEVEPSSYSSTSSSFISQRRIKLKPPPIPSTARPGRKHDDNRRQPPSNATQTTPPKRPRPVPPRRTVDSGPGLFRPHDTVTPKVHRPEAKAIKKGNRICSPPEANEMDSPDPLALARKRSTSPAGRSSCVPISPTRSGARTSIDTDKEVEDITPKPKVREKEKEKAKGGGHAFFADMKRMSFGETQRRRLSQSPVKGGSLMMEEEDVEVYEAVEKSEEQLEREAWLGEDYISSSDRGRVGLVLIFV